jgi:hypothetical protein
MQVELLRSNSIGLDATYTNCEDHAQNLIPLIDHLVEYVKTRCNFAKWRQGNNVHILVTKDGRQFVLRGFTEGSPKKYQGIYLTYRESRSKEHFLMTVRADGTDTNGLRRLSSFLKQASESTPPGNIAGGQYSL